MRSERGLQYSALLYIPVSCPLFDLRVREEFLNKTPTPAVVFFSLFISTSYLNLRRGKTPEMPIATRYVEPRSVCADPLLTEEATRAGDALQAVAVRSMAGLIRQLGSLARHAESVMGELAESLASCHARTVNLEKRTRALKVEVLPSLDPDREGK